MNQMVTYKQEEKATVCVSNNCITVYGEAARFLNAVAVFVALISAAVFLYKLATR